MAEVIAALCRHGEYEQPEQVPSAHLLHPLTARGRKQASALAQELLALARTHNFRIHPIIDCSSLLRAYETASIVADQLTTTTDSSFAVEEFQALSERCLGAAANLRIDQIEAILARDPRYAIPPAGWKASADYRLPFIGAESLLDAGARIARHLRARTAGLRRDEHGTVLKVFVGHGGGYRHAAACLGTLRLTEIPHLSMHHARAVCLRSDDNQPWTLVAGAFKQRKRGDEARD